MAQKESWKKVLRPFEDEWRAMYERWLGQLAAMPPGERLRLFDAAQKPSETNCSWAMFRAAQEVRAALPAIREAIEAEVAATSAEEE